MTCRRHDATVIAHKLLLVSIPELIHLTRLK